MTTTALHLASASPRRRDILAALGLVFTWGGVAVEERRRGNETADAMVLRLAAAKARAAGVAGVVIGADTAVVLGDRVFGKPAGPDDALAMLDALSGRTHRVVTGVAVHSPRGLDTALSATEVRFRDIRQDEALAYWQSGEPRDKAGAYAIQGCGGVFVEAIRGSYSGVVGLPVFETARLLQAAGLDVLDMAVAGGPTGGR
jgi:septum formation protein